MNATPLLEARAVTRTFGHVTALAGADFSAYPGQVTGLIGDNGAGKSTLVKILSGADAPSTGTLLIDGEAVEFSGPHSAQALGIETVYQDLALAQDLSSVANFYLGRELFKGGLPGRFGMLDRRAMRLATEDHLRDLDVKLKSSSAPIADLSGGQRQSVAIARAAMWAQRLIFMDEPTAALGVAQTARVLDLIKRVRDRGLAVVLISHNMQHVLDVCDRIEVLRLGRRVATFDATASVQQLVAAMTADAAPEEAA